MIKIEKITNKQHLYSCNLCRGDEKEKNSNLYEIAFLHINENGASGTVVTLCEDCLKELQKKINSTIEKDRLEKLDKLLEE